MPNLIPTLSHIESSQAASAALNNARSSTPDKRPFSQTTFPLIMVKATGPVTPPGEAGSQDREPHRPAPELRHLS